MNSCTFAGSVYRKPELKKTVNGKSYIRFMVKVPKSTGQGEIFVPVQAWGILAESTKLNDDTQVLVNGSYETSSYEKNGEKVYQHHFNLRSILMLADDNSKYLNIEDMDFII